MFSTRSLIAGAGLLAVAGCSTAVRPVVADTGPEQGCRHIPEGRGSLPACGIRSGDAGRQGRQHEYAVGQVFHRLRAMRRASHGDQVQPVPWNFANVGFGDPYPPYGYGYGYPIRLWQPVFLWLSLWLLPGLFRVWLRLWLWPIRLRLWWLPRLWRVSRRRRVPWRRGPSGSTISRLAVSENCSVSGQALACALFAYPPSVRYCRSSTHRMVGATGIEPVTPAV